ncbi:glycoside hydrolase family 88 protein [Paenibacillus sp. MBLB4367]|uniref:glycoside hydrolase family 88 protein n=1 Tax=Paenibacillus sp. MBLB4367 TaxID=3384767 RepID=UPI0039083950
MNRVADEGIRYPERFTGGLGMTKAECEQAIAFVLRKIDQNLETFVDTFPAPASTNLVYEATDNEEWTPAFWTGMLWLAYEVTGDDKYRRVAEIQLDTFKKRAEERIGTETHDLGFLYTLSCVAAYRLTGNEEAKRTALLAADLLMTRYYDKAGIIQAWGNLSNPEQRGRMIIDCCMNLPLLYWAAEMTGNPAYYDAAVSHAKQAAAYLIRDNASSYHTFYMDVETGEPKYGKTSQGYSDDSCWSRGQAWAIYGFPLTYVYTGNPEMLELTKRVSHYFLNRLPEDFVCYWDLVFTDGPEERDSSAAAIAVCGLMELAKHLPPTDETRAVYEQAALKMLKSLADSYTSAERPDSNGVLLHGVYGKPLGNGVDECCIWGDYYYFEALVRATRDWKLYW